MYHLNFVLILRFIVNFLIDFFNLRRMLYFSLRRNIYYYYIILSHVLKLFSPKLNLSIYIYNFYLR